MENSRKIMDLQGLLRLAVQQQDPATAVSSENITLDPERKQFLDKVLKSMTVDVMEELIKAMNILENSESTYEEKKNSLVVIRDYIDNIDFANSFVKANGLKIITKYLKAEESELQTAAIYIIAEMAQNNPFCQKQFLDEQILQLLISNFKKEEDVAKSSVHAVSALIRNFEPGLCEFIRLGGIKSLLECLKSEHAKVYIKTAFLIATISSEQPSIRDEFNKQNAFKLLVQNLETVQGFDIKIETTLFALSELSKGSGWHPPETERLEIKQLLKDLITINSELPESEDIVTYAQNILNKI